MSDLFQNISINWRHLSKKKIFLACSGGVDSMTLLYLFNKANWDIEVMHVNYHLRNEDSNLDQALVENTCKKLNIPFHLKDIELQKILNQKKGNLQEIARNVRYDFFEEKRIISEDNFIALGQHLDDQVETFFMHLARKSGIMGMSCMSENHNRFVRPLLPFSKMEIIDFAKKNNIEWREDYSNKTNKYKRNILRNIIIPELISEIPSLKESVLTLIKTFQETQLLLEVKIKPILQSILENKELSFSDYDAFSQEEKIELLRQLGQKPGLLIDLENIRKSQKGKKILLEVNEAYYFESIYNENDKFIFSNPLVTIDAQLNIENVDQLPKHFSTAEIYIDLEKIEGNLILRKWKAGDRMKPIGLNGSKLVSDIIKDAKIPTSEKENIFVVSDKNNILWCVGIRVSSIAIANENTTKIAKITIQKTN